MELPRVLQEIAGLEGSYVSLGFERSPGELFVVDLVRSHACYPDEVRFVTSQYDLRRECRVVDSATSPLKTSPG